MKKDLIFSPEALEICLCYQWPGNIRELRNAVVFAAHTTQGNVVYPENLPEWLKSSCKDIGKINKKSLKERLQCFQVHLIQYYLNQNSTTIEEIAKKLGLSVSSLYRKLNWKGKKGGAASNLAT
jgi:transcriptional regulator with PAS, ATPase and Fis domain